MTTHLKLYLAMMGMASTAVVVGLVWWSMCPVPWEPATTPPVLRQIDKVTITPPSVRVYAPAAKKALKLAPEIQADPDKHIVAAVDCGDRTIAAVLDVKTGEVTVVQQVKPLPWLAFERHGQARVDIGLKGSAQITRLSIQQDFVQAKAIHAGISATLDSDRTYFVGVGGGWKW